MGKIKHICIGAEQGGPKTEIKKAVFLENEGIEGDFHSTSFVSGQIRLLSDLDIQGQIKVGYIPGMYSENLVLSGIDFNTIGVGTKISLGGSVILQINKIGKHLPVSGTAKQVQENHLMAHSGLLASVKKAGTVGVGSDVEIVHKVPRSFFQVVVLTISDRCSRGEAGDTAGPAVVNLVNDNLEAFIYATEIIADDQPEIIKKLKLYSDVGFVDLLITVGGTGPAPRDITPEATLAVVDRLMPGFDEAMRFASLKKTPMAILSRGVSGIRGSTFIINLPGSERGAVENLSCLLSALPHGIKKLRGDPSDCDCCRVNVSEKIETVNVA